MRILVAVALLFLVGCVTKGTQVKMNSVSVGMTKPEVIDVLGSPDSSAAKDGIEYLRYGLTDGTSGGTAASCAGAGIITLGLIYIAPQCRGGMEDDFFVRLKEGKVDAYGKIGDFDSTEDPTIKVEVD